MGLFHHVLVYMGDGRPTFGPSCTEFVYPGSCHFDNRATSKFDDVLLDHSGLPHVLPLAIHLDFFWVENSKMVLLFEWVVAYSILVSASVPFAFGFRYYWDMVGIK